MQRRNRKEEVSGSPGQLELFEAQRPRLIGIAYRILGSRADAEDVVQDGLVKWLEVDVEQIDRPAAWMTTVVTRRAIDILQSAQRTRVDYIGHWLPEPAMTDTDRSPEELVELSSSLSTAFLLLLERLSPKERAAFLLREVFDQSYEEVSDAIGVKQDACRKLVSRAKAEVANREGRYRPDTERQEALLAAFMDAVRTGAPGALSHMLADDVALRADGGGKAAAILEGLNGESVLRFITENLHLWWREFAPRACELNGTLGLILHDGNTIVAAVTFSFCRAARVSEIQIMRNPDKLTALEFPKVH